MFGPWFARHLCLSYSSRCFFGWVYLPSPQELAAMDSSAKRARIEEGSDEPARTLTLLGVIQFSPQDQGTTAPLSWIRRTWVGNYDHHNHQRTRPPATLFPPCLCWVPSGYFNLPNGWCVVRQRQSVFFCANSIYILALCCRIEHMQHGSSKANAMRLPL